jgi:hypothetical protein
LPVNRQNRVGFALRRKVVFLWSDVILWQKKLTKIKEIKMF